MLGRRKGEQDRSGRRGRPALPPGVRVDLGRGERALAVAQDDPTGSWVVLTTYRVLVLDPTGTGWVDRPWHEVDTGAWDPDTFTLSVGWVDQDTGMQWRVRDRTGPGRLPEVFWERVAASVVLVREVDLGGRRSARVSVRTVLSSRELIDQVLPGPAAQDGDAELAAAVREARRDLRDQVGLPPD